MSLLGTILDSPYTSGYPTFLTIDGIEFRTYNYCYPDGAKSVLYCDKSNGIYLPLSVALYTFDNLKIASHIRPMKL